MNAKNEQPKETTAAPVISVDMMCLFFQDVYECTAFEDEILPRLKKLGLKGVVWFGSSEDEENPYLELYMTGYELVEQKRYEDALRPLRAALTLNPAGINARFEICECYFQLHDLNAAREELMRLVPFLNERKRIARFYRRMGFFCTESGQYPEALACFAYSVRMADHPSVKEEVEYILQAARKNGQDMRSLVNRNNLHGILVRAGIPVITHFVIIDESGDDHDDLPGDESE